MESNLSCTGNRYCPYESKGDRNCISPTKTDVNCISPTKTDINCISPAKTDVNWISPTKTDINCISPSKTDVNCISPTKTNTKIKLTPKSKKHISKEERLKTPDKRFGGLTEEDVKKLFLPDHLEENLDIIFVGINPGLMSAYKGHHYCNPCNHFWPLLFDSGLIPEQLTYQSDFRCLEYGIGMTNIVARTTRNAAELSKNEIAAGKESLLRLIKHLKPLVLCFNGKGIYEIFSAGKCTVGRQEDIHDTAVYVMPSTSGLVAQYPSKKDKLIFFNQLKSLRDEMKGKINQIR